MGLKMTEIDIAGIKAYLGRVGKKIQKARKTAGLRQIDVNQRIGLTYRHYQDIEAGKVNMTIGTLYRLSTLFKANIRDLIEETPSEELVANVQTD
jgi:transcriptional regulator with XRE-family HTH domain